MKKKLIKIGFFIKKLNLHGCEGIQNDSFEYGHDEK
jgi:hypothetical protein